MANNKDESTVSRQSVNFLENISFNNDANKLLQILINKRNVPRSNRIFGSLSPKNKPIKFPPVYIKTKVQHEKQSNNDDDVIIIEKQNKNCNSNLSTEKSKRIAPKSLEKLKNQNRTGFHPTASSTPQSIPSRSSSSLSTISLLSSNEKQQKTLENGRNNDNIRNFEDIGVLPIDNDDDNNDQVLWEMEPEEDGEERTLQEEEQQQQSENENELYSQHTIVTTTIHKNNQSKNVTNSHSHNQNKELNTNITTIEQNQQINELLSHSVDIDETFEDIVQNNQNSNDKHERNSNSENLIEKQQQNVTHNKTITKNNISKNRTLHNQISKNGISKKNISRNVNNNEKRIRMQSKENSLNNEINDKNQKITQNTSKTSQIITNNEIENDDEIGNENEIEVENENEIEVQNDNEIEVANEIDNENQNIMETNHIPAVEEVILEEQEYLTFNDKSKKHNSCNRNSPIRKTNGELMELFLSQHPFNESNIDIIDDMDPNSPPKWLTDVIKEKNKKKIGNTETRKRKVGSRKIKRQNVNTVEEDYLEITKRFPLKKSNKHKLSNTRRTLYTKGQSDDSDNSVDVDNQEKNSEKILKPSKSVLKPIENTINQKDKLCPAEVIIKLKQLKYSDKKSDVKGKKSSINSTNNQDINLKSKSKTDTRKAHQEHTDTELFEIAEVNDVDLINQHEIPIKQKETKTKRATKRTVENNKKSSEPDGTLAKTANKEDENVVGLRRSARPHCHRKAYWLNDRVDIEETEIWQQFQIIKQIKKGKFNKNNEKKKSNEINEKGKSAKSKSKANKKQTEIEPMENTEVINLNEQEIITENIETTENLNKNTKNHICEVIMEENENESKDLVNDDQRIKKTTLNVTKKTRKNVKENSKSRRYRRIVVDDSSDNDDEIIDSNENLKVNDVTNTGNIQKNGNNTINMNNNEHQESYNQNHNNDNDDDNERLFSQNNVNLDDNNKFRRSQRIQNKANNKKETCIDSGNASDDNITLNTINQNHRSRAEKRNNNDDGKNKHKSVHRDHSEEIRPDKWLQKFANSEWNLNNDSCITNAFLKDDLNLGMASLKDLVFKKKDNVEYAFFRTNYGFLRVHSNSEKKLCRQKYHDKLNFLVLLGNAIFYVGEKIFHCSGGDLVTILKGQNYKIQNNTESEVLLLFSS